MSEMNEVEVLLELLNKMVDSKLQENPKGGMKISNDCKMKYSDMKESLGRLRGLVLNWGQITCYSICKNCGCYRQGSGINGRCENNDRDKATSVHPYYTCWRNTDARFEQGDRKKFTPPKYPSEEKK